MAALKANVKNRKFIVQEEEVEEKKEEEKSYEDEEAKNTFRETVDSDQNLGMM